MICILILHGCTVNDGSAKKISPPTSFSASFVSGEFAGEITYNNMAKTEIVFSEPESVRGLTVSTENEKLTMEYADMKYASDKSNQSSSSLSDTIVNVISDILLNNEKLEAYEENGETVRQGSNYKLYQNSDNGYITRIISNKYDIKLNQK